MPSWSGVSLYKLLPASHWHEQRETEGECVQFVRRASHKAQTFALLQAGSDRPDDAWHRTVPAQHESGEREALLLHHPSLVRILSDSADKRLNTFFSASSYREAVGKMMMLKPGSEMQCQMGGKLTDSFPDQDVLQWQLMLERELRNYGTSQQVSHLMTEDPLPSPAPPSSSITRLSDLILPLIDLK